MLFIGQKFRKKLIIICLLNQKNIEPNNAISTILQQDFDTGITVNG